MRRPGDYQGEMISTHISDQAIELLLGNEPDVGAEHAHLVRFIDRFRAYGDRAPSEASIHRLAVEAAGIALEARPTVKPDEGASDRKPRFRLTARPQLAAVITVLVLAWGTGVAAAADDAAPGHSLYGLDLALERVGIGAGSVGERLEEVGRLLAGGETRFALEHAAKALEGEDGEFEPARVALDLAIEALSVGDAQTEASSQVVDEVAAVLAYLNENVGPGVGADGREFGQGVAELARGISQSGQDEEQGGATGGQAGEPVDPRPSPGITPEPHGNGDNANSGDNGNGNNANPGDNANNANPGDNGNNANPGDNANKGNNGNTGNGNEAKGGGPGNGNGPPEESPSATAPGRGNRP